MKYKVCNQNQRNLGVSYLEPRIILTAKSKDLKKKKNEDPGLPLCQATLWISFLPSSTSATQNTILHSSLVPFLLCAFYGHSLACNAHKFQAEPYLWSTPSWPTLTTSLLSSALRTKITVHSICYAPIMGRAWAGIPPARNSQYGGNETRA